MRLADSSQSVFNGYISIMRNMYLISSIGLATMAFSGKFTRYKTLVKLLALSIFIYSTIYGIKSTHDFKEYLELLKKQNDLSDHNHMQLKQWNEWIYFGYVYIFILIVLSIIIFFKKII